MSYELSCADVGAGSCTGHFSGDTTDELIGKVAKHLQDKHKLRTVPQTIVNLALANVRTT